MNKLPRLLLWLLLMTSVACVTTPPILPLPKFDPVNPVKDSTPKVVQPTVWERTAAYKARQERFAAMEQRQRKFLEMVKEAQAMDALALKCTGAPLSRTFDTWACEELTRKVEESTLFKKSRWLAKACEGFPNENLPHWKGDPRACWLLGHESLLTQDFFQATQRFTRACQSRGSIATEACDMLWHTAKAWGESGESGDRLKKAYGVACTALQAPACRAAGKLWLKNEPNQRADVRAAQLFQDGCNLDDWSACWQFAWMMERGRGVSANPSGAADLYERACEVGEPAACFALSKMVGEGRGVDQDARRARRLMKKACREGWKPACKRP